MLRRLDAPLRDKRHATRSRPSRWSSLGRGFTYAALLFALAVLGVFALLGNAVHQTERLRESETELLRIGNEYRNALASYAAQAPRGSPRYPMRMEDLLRDPRVPFPRRHMRRIYRDPVTGKVEWGLLRQGSGIVAIHSVSKAVPLRTGDFDEADAAFDSAPSHAQWIFAPKEVAGAITGTLPGLTRDIYQLSDQTTRP